MEQSDFNHLGADFALPTTSPLTTNDQLRLLFQQQSACSLPTACSLAYGAQGVVSRSWSTSSAHTPLTSVSPSPSPMSSAPLFDPTSRTSSSSLDTAPLYRQSSDSDIGASSRESTLTVSVSSARQTPVPKRSIVQPVKRRASDESELAAGLRMQITQMLWPELPIDASSECVPDEASKPQACKATSDYNTHDDDSQTRSMSDTKCSARTSKQYVCEIYRL